MNRGDGVKDGGINVICVVCKRFSMAHSVLAVGGKVTKHFISGDAVSSSTCQ
jgi:hypothetical protein